MKENYRAKVRERRQAEKKAFDHKALWQNRHFKNDSQLLIKPLEFLASRPLYKTALKLLGKIEGKKILGCGSGEMSVLLAKYGALVTGYDISQEQTKLAEQRALVNSVADKCTFVSSSLEDSSLAKDEFDLVFGAFILHHVSCLEEVSQNVARCLKVGGKAVFIETVASNPLLMFARRYLAGRFGISRFGTDTESPLTIKQIKLFARAFCDYRIVYANFVFFHFISTYLLHDRKNLKWISTALLAIDKWIYEHLGRLRKYTYWWILEFTKG